jgi:transcription initiation factor TFIID subunit 3
MKATMPSPLFDRGTALKKKHSKTGEESRYQGTVLGKGADSKPMKIDGGDVDSIEAWEAKLRHREISSRPTSSGKLSSVGFEGFDA